MLEYRVLNFFSELGFFRNWVGYAKIGPIRSLAFLVVCYRTVFLLDFEKTNES